MDTLKNEYEILHLLYVTQYNQHRTQVWWKYVSMLHRRLAQIVAKNNIKDKEQGPRLARYVVLKLVPGAYRAFQNILAQGAFITLGFTLLALLARVRSTLLKMFGTHFPTKSTRKSSLVRASNSKPEILQILDMDADDLGEEVDPATETLPIPDPAPLMVKGASTARSQTRSERPRLESSSLKDGKKRKSKKKKNAIDDIFAGLG